MRLKREFCCLTAMGLLALAPGAAQAQQSADASAGDAANAGDQFDIVVTAQKRSERAQDVPIAISAFSGSMLEKSNVMSVSDLVRIAPSVRFDSGLNFAKARIVIRGIGSQGGTAAEPSVATFVDGIYVPREGATLGAYLDLQGMEVLRGPQGTLFGRNASAGAISLTSALPTGDFSGRLSIEGGTGGRYRGEGVVNIPASERANFRLAVMGQAFAGLYKNKLDGRRVGGQDSFAGRLTGVFDLSDNVKWTLRGSLSASDGDAWAPYLVLPDSFPEGRLQQYLDRYAAIGSHDFDLKPFDRTVNQYIADDLRDRQRGISSQFDIDVGGGFSVKLLDAFQYWKNDQINTGVMGAAVPTLTQYVGWSSKNHSHELQLISPERGLFGEAFDFVAGVYYFHEDYTSYSRVIQQTAYCSLVTLAAAVKEACLAGAGSPAYGANYSQTANSFAFYGQGTVHVAPTLDLVLGARWTNDKKRGHIVQNLYSLSGAASVTPEDNRLAYKGDKATWRAGLNWRPSRDSLLFLSWSTGYKSGGFNSEASPTAVFGGRAFQPETVRNIELGAKTQWLDRALTLNATFYHMTVRNFQDRSYNGQHFSQRNAGDIRNVGVEVDASARLGNQFRLNASVAYLDSKFTDYPGGANLPGRTGTQDLTGKRPTYTPKWSGTVGAEYEAALGDSGWTLLARGDLTFVSSEPVGSINDGNPLTYQDARQLLGGRIALSSPGDQWTLSLFGANLTNKGYCTSRAYVAFGGLLGVTVPGQTALRCLTVAPPRTMGVNLATKF